MTKQKLLITFLVIFLGIWCYVVEPRMLEVNKITIQDSELKGIKIVFASDFHVKPYGQKRLDIIVKKINAENPDIVLSVGDYVCGHTRHSTLPIEDIAKTLSKVKTKYGFYTSLGNHDGWYDPAEIAMNLEENGIKVLSNSNVALNIRGKKIYIAGIEDLMTGAPNVYEALEGTGLGIGENEKGKKAPIIMLTHTPDMFPKVQKEVNLTLAGHTHGGQIRIPFLGPLFTASSYRDKYAKGFIEENGKKLFVTRGIGVSILPLRFNCVPEINVIEFE